MTDPTPEPTPDPTPEPTPAQLTSDVKNWGMLAHLSALVQFVGIPSFVGPLVVWLVKREEHPYIDANGKEALNFNISMAIYFVASAILVLLLIGILLIIAVGIVWLVFTIIAAIKAANGERYRYPLTIRFVS